MLSRKYLLSALTNHRLISSSCCLQKKKSFGSGLGKEVRTMKKIMAGREKGKRRFVYNENLPKLESVKKISDSRGQPKEINRRITVLNKLFMKNITDLMATDSFSKKISGYGIQISMVKVSPDFRLVNVFWLAQADENDNIIEETLKCIAGPLRHELSQLRLMGEVPRIFFIKDKHYSKAAEVDVLLAKADFGDDFVPSDPTLFMKSKPELYMTLPEDLKKKIYELEESLLEDDLNDDDIPEMRHDVLGLDHSQIMKKIATSIVATKRAWEHFESKGSTNETQTTYTPDFTTVRERMQKLRVEENLREDFITYLRKKQIESNKKHKGIALQVDVDEDDWEEDQEDFREDYDFEDNSQYFDEDDRSK